MKRKVFLVINGVVVAVNLALMGFTMSLGANPVFCIMSLLCGAFGIAYWMFHDN